MALMGNQTWTMRKKHGKDKKYTTDEILWDECVSYFEWAEKHPLEEEKVMLSEGQPKKVKINKVRAMTNVGLCIHLNISRATWATYRDTDGYREVTELVDNIIYEQKFSGASAGLMNPAIIMRDLGLAERSDVTSGGKTIKNEYHIHPVTTVKNAGD